MEKRFTPPTTFPAIYQSNLGVPVTLIAAMPNGRYIGYFTFSDNNHSPGDWATTGRYSKYEESCNDIFDVEEV